MLTSYTYAELSALPTIRKNVYGDLKIETDKLRVYLEGLTVHMEFLSDHVESYTV